TITKNAEHMTQGSVELIYSSFNRLLFHVSSESPSVFGLSYPYTGNWSARVNDKNVPLYRSNGIAHAVEVPAGESIIEFKYFSRACYWGMFISCATFVLIGIFVGYNSLGGIRGTGCTVLIAAVGAAGFMFWYNSLYNGDNLKTQYRWTYKAPLAMPDLAYGKKNWLTPEANPMPYPHTAKEARTSKLVDGERSGGSGFSSGICDNPAWFLDLNSDRNIKTIVLYESVYTPAVVLWPASMLRQKGLLSGMDLLTNVRPLEIALSDNGNSWRTVASVESREKGESPESIVFERPLKARYIRIMASGKSRLSLDEVEVFGREDNGGQNIK
ncbi:MAG: YfhO family protein, partial [Nitrospirota bacterium]